MVSFEEIIFNSKLASTTTTITTTKTTTTTTPHGQKTSSTTTTTTETLNHTSPRLFSFATKDSPKTTNFNFILIPLIGIFILIGWWYFWSKANVKFKSFNFSFRRLIKN